MRGSRGGWGGPDPPSPLEFAKLNIADITGNEKIRPSDFAHICALKQPVIRQGWTPLENFSGPARLHEYIYSILKG